MNKYTPEKLDQIFSRIKEFVVNPDLKLRIIDLRKFIDEIYPRETDTSKQDIADIRQRFVGLNKRVATIEKCMGIDFELDDIKPVNYDFIKDNLMRDKINAYYREMLRYQFGTRNHKICFGEFCRLAVIQIEFMLNYYYNHNYVDLFKHKAKSEYDKAYEEWKSKGKVGSEPDKTIIVKKTINELQNNKEKSLCQLTFAFKSFYFLKEIIKINNIRRKNNVNITTNIISISIYTANMRNRKSHGNKSTIGPYEENYLTEEETSNLEKWEKKIIELVKKHNETNSIKIKFENNRIIAKEEGWNKMSKKLKKLYNEDFLPLQWVSEKSFDDVHELLHLIAKTCAKELAKKN